MVGAKLSKRQLRNCTSRKAKSCHLRRLVASARTAIDWAASKTRIILAGILAVALAHRVVRVLVTEDDDIDLVAVGGDQNLVGVAALGLIVCRAASDNCFAWWLLAGGGLTAAGKGGDGDGEDEKAEELEELHIELGWR